MLYCKYVHKQQSETRKLRQARGTKETVMEYQVTSFSEGKKGGQITVTVGEGRNRRSFTRHLNSAMVGLNIDERAIPLNERYESELTIAKGNLASTEGKLELIKKQLEKANEVEPNGFIANVAIAIVKAELEAALDVAEEAVATTTEVVDDAETKLHIVQRELPLMMEFRR